MNHVRTITITISGVLTLTLTILQVIIQSIADLTVMSMEGLKFPCLAIISNIMSA